jgi:hypothetical protein
MEIWESKPPGTLWPSPVLLRDCFTFLSLADTCWPETKEAKMVYLFMLDLTELSGAFIIQGDSGRKVDILE